MITMERIAELRILVDANRVTKNTSVALGNDEFLSLLTAAEIGVRAEALAAASERVGPIDPDNPCEGCVNCNSPQFYPDSCAGCSRHARYNLIDNFQRRAK